MEFNNVILWLAFVLYILRYVVQILAFQALHCFEGSLHMLCMVTLKRSQTD
jgi:hypothetical protein